MTIVALSREQVNEAADIKQALSQLKGLVSELERVSDNYPFSKHTVAETALEAKMTADQVYKQALR